MDCPKCESVNTYLIDGMGACRTCGGRWLPEGQKPYTGGKTEEEEMRSKGTCTNCGREGNLQSGGHCSFCYSARKGLEKGTPEYDRALAEAKKRFTDPDYKRGGWKKVTKPGKNAAIKHGGLSNDAIIEHLQEQRDDHLLAAKKLDEAITLLEN